MINLSDNDLRELASEAPLDWLMAEASRLRDLGHGNRMSYSRKVFIPLTRLCRDVCRYCTFSASQIMMITMPGQFKKHQAPEDMAAVPAVFWHGPFISAFSLLSFQSIVFNVIDCFQQ